jgi:RNA polymerase sigma-70 factor (ECF subfamily)
MEPHRHNERCKEVFAMLSDYLNLELPPEACHEIEAHIAGCPPCIEFAESLRKTVDLCRRYQPAELPRPMGQEAKAQLLDAYKKMLAARMSDQSG